MVLGLLVDLRPVDVVFDFLYLLRETQIRAASDFCRVPRILTSAGLGRDVLDHDGVARAEGVVESAVPCWVPGRGRSARRDARGRVAAVREAVENDARWVGYSRIIDLDDYLVP